METSFMGVHERHCPFMEHSLVKCLLCFDAWLDEYDDPPDRAVRDWCQGDFSACPTYIAYTRNMAFRVRHHQT